MTSPTRTALLGLALLSSLLACCTPGGEIPVLGWYRDEDSLARVAIEYARTYQCDSLVALLDPTFAEEKGYDCNDPSWSSLQEPAPVPSKLRLVGYQAGRQLHDGPLGRDYIDITILTYEATWPDRHSLLRLVIADEQVEHRILGFGIMKDTVPIEEMNGLDLTLVSPKHLIFIILMLLGILFAVYSFVLLVRSDDPKKWLWMILIPIGMGQISLNWTTGDIDWRIFSFTFPFVFVAKEFAWEPWMFTLFMPVGAFICWFRYRERKEGEAGETEAQNARAAIESTPDPPANEGPDNEGRAAASDSVDGISAETERLEGTE